MKILQQSISTLFVLLLFLLAVTMLYAADTEKIIIKDEEPELTIRNEEPHATQTTLDADESHKVRTTVTTVTETEAVPAAAGPTRYERSYNPEEDIQVDIQMDNHVFQPNENVKGQIVVNNTTPEPLPATFHVKLFHDNQLFRHMKVQTEDKTIPPGITRYSLRDFGIPDLNKNRNYSGEWTIMVYQDDPGRSEEENFRLERIDI